MIVPTPSPARKVISSPKSRTVVKTAVPLVMSGSSPENLMTSARMPSEIFSTRAIGIVNVVPSRAIIFLASELMRAMIIFVLS